MQLKTFTYEWQDQLIKLHTEPTSPRIAHLRSSCPVHSQHVKVRPVGHSTASYSRICLGAIALSSVQLCSPLVLDYGILQRSPSTLPSHTAKHYKTGNEIVSAKCECASVLAGSFLLSALCRYSAVGVLAFEMEDSKEKGCRQVMVFPQPHKPTASRRRDLGYDAFRYLVHRIQRTQGFVRTN
jgi:hypothetical protein